MTDAVQRWDDLERAFAARQYDGDRALLASIEPGAREVRPGVFALPARRLPGTVLTAVHGTNHTRDGRLKLADRGTGGLALVLAAATGCGALVTLGTHGDANHDPNHPAKDALRDLPGVRHVIDLHGAAHRSDSPDIGLGTSTGRTPARFVDALRADLRLAVTVDARHAAKGPHRLASFAQRHGRRAVQVEVDALARPPAGSAERRGVLLAALTDAVRTLC